MAKKVRSLPVIGWREWAELPELGIDQIKVKIDTGARSSALHAYKIRRFQIERQTWVRFAVHPIQRDAKTTVWCESPLVDERRVRSSSGRSTLRPVILTAIELGGRRWPIEVTLIRRDVMGFRMLLGRQAIRRRFLVHAGRSFLQSAKPAIATASIPSTEG